MSQKQVEEWLRQEAKRVWPGITQETKVFWMNTIKPKFAVVPCNGEDEKVKLNGVVGDYEDSFKVGYGPKSDTLVVCRKGGKWVREPESGYQRWKGNKDRIA